MKFILFIFIITSFFSCATAKNSANIGLEDINNTEITGVENTVTITGRVQVYGNEPFTFVGIVDMDNVEYAVYPRSKEDELRQLQGYLIKFTVVFLDEPKAYGSMFLRGGTVEPTSWEILEN